MSDTSHKRAIDVGKATGSKWRQPSALPTPGLHAEADVEKLEERCV
jgi:hypothetical protein